MLVTPARGWASSGRVKIERAKEHIGDLETTSRRFFDGNPYSLFAEPDSELGGYVLRIVEREAAPLRWSAIASDAVHNLRSSLDILWRLAMHGLHPTARNAYFPIYDTAKKCESGFPGEPKRANQKAAVDLLKAAKPYKGGNDALWSLNAIDARNKHEMLTVAVCAFRSLLVKAYPSTTIRMRPEDFLSPIEDGTIMCHLAGDLPSPMEVQHEFTFEVTFGKGEILEGEPVLPTLHQFANTVDGVVEAFVAAGLLP